MGTATAVSSTHDTSQPMRLLNPSPPGFEQRQQLILENLAVVHSIAHRIHAGLPRHVLLSDLVNSGVLGLIDAVEKFDPAKNISLRGYAQIRIRGAILDSLRKLDWGPRSLRCDARRIEQAYTFLSAGLGRAPTEPEIADHLVLKLERYQRILSQLHSVAAGIRQEPTEFSSQEARSGAPADRPSEDPFQMCVRAEASGMLSEAISTLGERERQAIALYYFEELTMKEVGTVLNIQESRVSQIISAAVDLLRARLRGRENSWSSSGRASMR